MIYNYDRSVIVADFEKLKNRIWSILYIPVASLKTGRKGKQREGKKRNVK